MPRAIRQSEPAGNRVGKFAVSPAPPSTSYTDSREIRSRIKPGGGQLRSVANMIAARDNFGREAPTFCIYRRL
jgi:hypothetical protein